MDRKQLKKNARSTAGSHWSLLVFAAAAAWIGMTILPVDQADVCHRIRSHIIDGRPVYDILNASVTSQTYLQTGLKWLCAAVISIFFLRIFAVAAARIFLEARTYEKVPVQHLFFLNAAHRWTKTAAAWFKRCLYLFLWSLTIVGGVIKYYSYFLVPFILAENPDLSGRDALNLSRRMMNGHKMEAFMLQLSMLPWFLLSTVTLGIAGILYVHPYAYAVYAEYYASLRNNAKQAALEGSAALNDTYLYEKADAQLLAKTYGDIRLDQRYVKMNAFKTGGLRSFLIKYLGFFAGRSKQRRLYQGTEDIRVQSQLSQDALDGKQYPFRLSPCYERKNAHYEGQLSPDRAYTIWSLVFYFVLSTFIVWVFIHIDMIPDFQVPQTLKGPWVLTGGICGLAALMLSSSLHHKPVVLYILNALVNAVVFLLTYGTGNPAMIVYAAVAGSLMEMALIYIIAPLIDSHLTNARRQWPMMIVSLGLLVLFIIDLL